MTWLRRVGAWLLDRLADCGEGYYNTGYPGGDDKPHGWYDVAGGYHDE